MPKSDTWPGGVAMETVISKDSTGSCDSVISMNSNLSDDSLDGFEPDVRDSLIFLDETLVSLELEEDSGLSNDELEPHTPTLTHSSAALPGNKVSICLPTHTWVEDVSKYHEDPNQVVGKDHKPSMSYMVPTPLLLANGPSLLRSRTSFSAADHKPKPTPHAPTSDAGIPRHANGTVGTTASQNSADPEGGTRDKLITVPAAVSASGPDDAAVPANTSEVIARAPEVTPAKLLTDAPEPPADKPVGPSELISGKHAADPAEMDASSVANTRHPVELTSISLADGPATDQTPTELQAPQVPEETPLTDSPTCAINKDATSATPVGDATTTPETPATAPVEVGMEFIPPPVDFMDEPVEDQDSETPVSSGINIADIPAPHVAAKDVSEISLPASDTPAPDILVQEIPNITFTESDIPAPDVPAQNISDGAFPVSDIPSPDVPAQDISSTAFPVSDIPSPDVPAQDISSTAFPASDIPAPVVPSSDVPSEDTPQATFPASDIPPPVILSAPVSPQVLPDAVHTDIVISPPEIPAQDNPDIPTPVIPTSDIPAPVIPAIDIAVSEDSQSVVPPSQNSLKESEAAGGETNVPPAPQRGPLSNSELEKLRKKASMKKAPGTAPVVQLRRPAALPQSSPTTEGLPGPPQEYCDAKSPPAVAPKPKKLPANIILKPHRSTEPVGGLLASTDRVRMDQNKVHMEALRKLGLIKSGEPDAGSCSGPSLSPRSRRSWAPSSGPLASPGANSSGPPTPEPLAQPAAPTSLGPLAQPPAGPKTQQLPAADTHSPKVSPAPNRKMVEVRLAHRQVPSVSDKGDSGSLGDNDDELEVPDHLPPSPPATQTTHTASNFDNSSTPRCHGISVQISPLGGEEDRKEALRKLGLLRD